MDNNKRRSEEAAAILDREWKHGLPAWSAGPTPERLLGKGFPLNQHLPTDVIVSASVCRAHPEGRPEGLCIERHAVLTHSTSRIPPRSETDAPTTFHVQRHIAMLFDLGAKGPYAPDFVRATLTYDWVLLGSRPGGWHSNQIMTFNFSFGLLEALGPDEIEYAQQSPSLLRFRSAEWNALLEHAA